MPEIRWDNHYRLGVPEMDAEHEKLINLASDLREAFYRDKGAETVGKILEDLLHLALTHFHNEECLMKASGFPDYSKHKKEHEVLAERVLKLRHQHETGEGDVSVEVLEFIHDWLIHHFQEYDRKYAFFLAQGSKVPH
jgi:hemerythrin-like metal-binding protein